MQKMKKAKLKTRNAKYSEQSCLICGRCPIQRVSNVSKCSQQTIQVHNAIAQNQTTTKTTHFFSTLWTEWRKQTLGLIWAGWKSNRTVEDSPHRPKNKWTGRHYGLSENVSRIWLNMERFGQRWVKMVAEWKSWVKMVKKERCAQTGRMSNLSLHTGCTPTVWPSWYIMIIQDTITSSSSWFWWANLWWGPWCFKTTKREKKWQLDSVGKNVEIGLILVSKSLISIWPMIRMIMVHKKRREMTIGLSAEKVKGNICFSGSEPDKPCLVFLASQCVDKMRF